MLIFALVVWILQGLIMLVDEFYYHRIRGLDRWERFGHPLDTLVYLFCFLFFVVFPPDYIWRQVWLALAAFSCVLITKDEWIHRQQAPAAECWLHSILFILHPLALYGGFELWQENQIKVLVGQCILIGSFGIYQFLYWNVFTKIKEASLEI